MPVTRNTHNKFLNLYINKKWKNKHSKRSKDTLMKNTANHSQYYNTLIEDACGDYEINDQFCEYYDYFNDIPVWNCTLCSYCNIERSSFCAVCNHSFYKNTNKFIGEPSNDIYFNGNDLINILVCKNPPKNVQFVTENELNEIFKSTTNTMIPVTQHLYTKYMNEITINKFLNYFNRKIKNKQQYPILKRLYSKMSNHHQIWNINKLSHTINWIQFMYNTYNNKLSKNTFNTLKIDKVFDNIRSNKYGDIIQCKQQYNQFKNATNILFNNCFNNTACPYNIKKIKNLISLNNFFINKNDTMKDINFFELKQKHFIDMNELFILETIKTYSTLFLTFTTSKNRNKSSTIPYIIFNIDRIESDIKNQCVFGKNKLNVKFPDFKFLDNNYNNHCNISKQCDIDSWCLFEKQFADNSQRKYALNVIEKVNKLLPSNSHKKENEIEISICKFIEENIQHFDDYKQTEIFENNSNLKLNHISCLYKLLIDRMECNILHNDKTCYICLDLINISGATPIKLECCNLLLHDDCYKNFIKSKLNIIQNDRIMLQQLCCMLCKNQIKHRFTNDKILEELNEKYIKIKQLALDEMNRMNGNYKYNDIYSYLFYNCDECNKLYFGGLKDCIQDFMEDEKDEEKERICLNCKPIMQNYKEECFVHGKEYIQWKCCFCCSLATFSCRTSNGTTHFCELCHKAPGRFELWKKQKNKKDELIQCPCLPDKDNNLPKKLKNTIKCPLGIIHPAHGEEYCLGCAMCNQLDRIQQK